MDIPPADDNTSPATSEVTMSDTQCADVLRFGWGRLAPDSLQMFNTPKWFVVFALVAVFIGGFVTSSITWVAPNSMEKHFGISSSQIGMLSLAYNVALGLMCVVAGHVCKTNKPWWIAVGLFFMAVGAVVVVLPKFLMGNYDAGISSEDGYCISANNGTAANEFDVVSDDRSSLYLAILVLGFIVFGVGSPAIWTLVPAHIEEVSDRRRSSLYIGLFQSIVLCVAPTVAFVIGKPLLNEWVDITKPSTSLQPTHSNWVGAWWCGILVGAVLLLLSLLPILPYPKVFHDTECVRKEKQRHVDSIQGEDFDTDIASMGKVMCSLLTNPMLVLINLAMSAEAVAIIGLNTFAQKFLHVQFYFTEADAALILGGLVAPVGAVGAFLGGYLVTRYDWNCKQMLRFSTTVAFLSAVSTVIFLVGCQSIDEPVHSNTIMNTCRTNCSCTSELYKPICALNNNGGSEGRVFFSPCHAGCFRNQSTHGVYSNCSCFPDDVTTAREGVCPKDCYLFPLVAIVVTAFMFISLMNNVPMLIVSLRVVHTGHQSLALGIREIAQRFLGFVPGPLIFGVLIDASCTVWQKGDHNETTNCLEYDRNAFRYHWFAACFALKMCSFVFNAWAYKLYRLPQKVVDEQTSTVVVNTRVDESQETSTYVDVEG